MYVIFDKKSGMIQGTVSGPDKSYGDLLTAKGDEWVFLEDAPLVDPTRNYIDPTTRKLVPFATITATLDKTTIVADGVDTATISSIPHGAYVTVDCDGIHQFAGVIDDGEAKLVAQAPHRFDIKILLQQHFSLSLSFMAVAPDAN